MEGSPLKIIGRPPTVVLSAELEARLLEVLKAARPSARLASPRAVKVEPAILSIPPTSS
jgi:hypothetical protein